MSVVQATGDVMTPIAPLFLEDLSVGQKFQTGTVLVDPERVKAFAAEFDPQPFHLDEAAGELEHLWRPGGERLAYRGDDHAA